MQSVGVWQRRLMAMVLSTTATATAAAMAVTTSASTALSSALSPDDAVGLALDRSDVVKSEALRVEASHLEGTAPSLRSPELQLGHRSLTTLGPVPPSSSSVDPFDDSQIGLSWHPPGLSDFGLRQSAGERDAEASWRDVDEARDDLAFEVRLLHARVRSWRAQRVLAQSRVTLLQQVATMQGDRLRERIGTSLDVGLTALDLLDAQADLADLEGDLGRIEQRLASIVGLPAPLSLLPSPVPLCVAPADDVDMLIGQSHARSPRLRSLVLRKEVVDNEKTQALLRYVPWIDAVQLGYLPKPQSDAELRLRVDIALPIFELTNPRGRVLELQDARLDAQRRAIEDDLAQRVRAARDRLVSTVGLVNVYATAAGDIDESQASVERSLAAEVTDVLRVAAVQERVMRVRRQALRAQLQCDEAAIELKRVSGVVAPPSTLPWQAATP